MKRVFRTLIPVLALCCAGAFLGGLSVRPSFASEGAFSAAVQTEGEKFFGDAYLSYYKVPVSEFDFDCNGGQTDSAPLKNAFDGNFATFWESKRQNARTDVGEEGNFTNEVTVTFHHPVTISSVLYQCSPNRGGTHGYPQQLEIVVTEDGAEKSLGVCSSTPTSSRVLFEIGEHTISKLRFSFTQPNTSHNWVATAREIVFLEPQSALIDRLASDFFADYAETSVKEDVDETLLSQMETELADRLSYTSEIAPILARARSILNDEFHKEDAREFKTEDGTLEQYGNIRTYCGNVLKMSNFGINYQPTGIAAAAGTRVTAYVEAGEGDPLPTLVFTQTFGDWRSWMGRVTLTRGKNVLTVPDYIAANPAAYTVPVQTKTVENGKTVYTKVRDLTAGGAIYLENPYTPEEQKGAKVYLEGGVFYPLFREGGDEEEFKTEISSYRDEMEREPSVYPDVAEVVSDHLLLSSLVGSAYDLFVTGTNSPRVSCEKWDEYMEGLLAFGGVFTSETAPHYNKIHEHLRHNLRLAQPWAGALAYSAGGFCGFCSGTYEDGFSLLNYHIYGWAMPHELGHSFDNNMGATGRTTAEITNNMWSIWSRVAVEHNEAERYSVETFRSELSPDTERAIKPYELHRGTGYVMWWQIESRYPGFWGEMENLYRYHSVEGDFAAAGVSEEEGKLLTQEERHAYLCSLAAKTDLGYYFDRWGFFFATETVGEGDDAKIVGKTPFSLNTSSAAYQKLMAHAKEEGLLPGEQLKFWYTDYENYNYVAGKGAGLYRSTDRTYIRKLYRTDAGYTLLLPEVSEAGHLGYEISEGGEVIGFTRGCSFTDSRHLPEGYTPAYTVRAFDRLLSYTAESAPVRPAASAAAVCRIGEVSFTSLADAVASAEAGNIIVCTAPELCLNGAISVEKDLTIISTCEGGSVLLRLGFDGNLITVRNGATLTAAGIVFDGGSLNQSGSFLRVESGASFNGEDVLFRNCLSKGDGAAISSGGTLTLTGTVFEGNFSRHGGAISVFSAPAKTHLTDCVFTANSAAGNGGAIQNIGTIGMTGCVFTDNSAQNGGAFANVSGGVAKTVAECIFLRNTASAEGGACYLDGNTCLTDGEIAGNSALRGGGISVRVGNSARVVSVQGVKFKSNRAEEGGACYLNTSFAGVGLDIVSAAFVANDAASGNALFVRSGKASIPREPIVTDDLTGGAWKINGEGEWKESLIAEEYADYDGEALFYVHFADGTVQQHKKGDAVDLPSGADLDGNNRFAGWRVNGAPRKAGEQITVDGDVYIAAEYTRVLQFTFSGSTAKDSTAEEGDLFELPDAEEIEGKRFLGWEADGTLYGAGAFLHAERNMAFTARYEDLPAEAPPTAEGETSNAPLIIGIALGVAAIVVLAAVFATTRLSRKKSGR